MKPTTLLLLIIAVLLAGIGVLLFKRLPPVPAKPVSAATGREECLTNQRMLHNAVQQWALENNRPDSALAPQQHDLVCPSGGRYIIITVADKPRCSIEAHLPK